MFKKWWFWVIVVIVIFIIAGTVSSRKVGNLSFTINKKDVESQVGPSLAEIKANGQYVILNITVKNNGNSAVTIDPSFFKLKEGNKSFSADSMASISANQNDDGTFQNSFFMHKLYPSSIASGNVVFDVAPEVSAATDLKLQIRDTTR